MSIDGGMGGNGKHIFISVWSKIYREYINIYNYNNIINGCTVEAQAQQYDVSRQSEKKVMRICCLFATDKDR